MARSGPLLTEAQWKKIAPLLPKPPKQRKGGRPWIGNRPRVDRVLRHPSLPRHFLFFPSRFHLMGVSGHRK